MDLRKIDLLIAAYISNPPCDVDLNGYSLPLPADLKNKALEQLPHYSTDIGAAWEVVEKIKNDFQRVFAINFKEGKWFVGFMHYWHEGLTLDDKDASVHESAPLAICLAALKSVGVDVSTLANEKSAE